MTEEEIEQNSLDVKKLNLIQKISARAVRLHKKSTGDKISRIQMSLDINQCLKKYPLDLPRLLRAQSSVFEHDVFGIKRHLDRETGYLNGGFLPRTMLQEGEDNKT